MVGIDPADLAKAASEGFDQATAEKVFRLLGILREFQARSDTRDKFTLKGGTALNVFHWPIAPRLSVDIDLMVTGFGNAAPGTADRTRVGRLVGTALADLGYRVVDERADAGWSFRSRYANSLGTQDELKVDLDLLNRMTLLPAVPKSGPLLFDADDFQFPVADPAELLGQKLTAVAYRAVERDLFDMHLLLSSNWDRRFPRARGMYLAYSFLQDHEWARLAYPVRLEVPYDRTRLRDLLRVGSEPPTLEQIRELAQAHLDQTARPFTSATPEEQELRRRLLAGDREGFGAIAGETDSALARALGEHPGLLWRLSQASRRARPADKIA